MDIDLKAAWEIAKEAARNAIETAFKEVGGEEPLEREEYAVKWCIEKLEKVDHALPAIGKYMDLPVVDWMQAQLVRQVVRSFLRREYAARKIEMILASDFADNSLEEEVCNDDGHE